MDDYEQVEAPDSTQALGAMSADWLFGWVDPFDVTGIHEAAGDTPFQDWWLQEDNPSETSLGQALGHLGAVVQTSGAAVQTADAYLPDPSTVVDVAKAAGWLAGLWLVVRLLGR
jgi:hypothetical protein